MDQPQNTGPGRGRSLSAASNSGAHQQPHIRQSHSPSPAPRPFNPNDAGLGLGIDASQQFAGYSPNPGNNFLNTQPPQPFGADPGFDLNQDPSTTQASLPYATTQAPSYSQEFMNPNFAGSDFSLFPPATGDQLNTPLFVTGDNAQQQQQQQQQQQPPQQHTPQQSHLGTPDLNMATSQAHNNSTPPHLLKVEPHQPGSAHQSPSFNQHQFSSPPGRHSRNASLGPEAALLPGQLDWSAAQFQGHRRTPSEYSDVSSVAPSPNLVSHDNFDHLEHSPMQRPQDAGLYQELHGIGSFSISDPPQAHSPDNRGRSPSHSPAISPRILPQQLPEMNQPGPGFAGPGQNGAFGPGPQYGLAAPGLQAPEAFPQLPQSAGQEMGMAPMAAPTINIDYAPTAVRTGFDGKPVMDTDALTPPEQRGRMRSRPRAVTDPYSSGPPRSPSGNSLSPNLGSDGSSRESSRSLSPLDRSSASPNRRRQSTSAVPNNVIALRLADPEFAAASGNDGTAGASGGGPKRVQKHPATFQCSLCPKRFTRAYNLRSHLRTHTDERPFVCTICGKAFARQHDRKRHEGLHSGEKKFVCKGDLKAGGQWGCGRRFARADALGRHFRSEAGRICIKPLLDEEMLERQRLWQEQRMQAAAHQQHAAHQGHPGLMMAPPGPPGIDPTTGYPVDASGNYALPAALLAQYPALAQVNWGAAGMEGGGGPGGPGGMDDDISGRSSFDASDYDETDDGGYVSGPGTGFGQGGMNEGFGEMGYASDFGGR